MSAPKPSNNPTTKGKANARAGGTWGNKKVEEVYVAKNTKNVMDKREKGVWLKRCIQIEKRVFNPMFLGGEGMWTVDQQAFQSHFSELKGTWDERVKSISTFRLVFGANPLSEAVIDYDWTVLFGNWELVDGKIKELTLLAVGLLEKHEGNIWTVSAIEEMLSARGIKRV